MGEFDFSFSYDGDALLDMKVGNKYRVAMYRHQQPEEKWWKLISIDGLAKVIYFFTFFIFFGYAYINSLCSGLPCYYSTPHAIYARIFRTDDRPLYAMRAAAATSEDWIDPMPDCIPTVEGKVMKCKWYAELVGTMAFVSFFVAMGMRLFKRTRDNRLKVLRAKEHARRLGDFEKRKLA